MKPCLFFVFLVLIVSSSVVAWKLTVPKQIALRSAAIIASVGLFSADNANAALTAAPWDSTVQYEVLQSGSGSAPKASDLVDIRFRGSYKGLKFDDTFKTEQPYTYRAGVGLLLPGVDNAIIHMKVGDKYHLVFSGENAFANGRPSAPGIPRIPPGGELDCTYLSYLTNLFSNSTVAALPSLHLNLFLNLFHFIIDSLFLYFLIISLLCDSFFADEVLLENMPGTEEEIILGDL